MAPEIAGVALPSWIPSSIDGGGVMGFITAVFFFFICCAIGGGAAYFLINKLKYKKKIIVFSKLNNSIQVIGKDRAMDFRVGKTGDLVLFCKKYKKYLPMPTLQMGINTYWFYVREDGEWINFSMPDIDEQMKEAGVHYLDKEMRYSRVALQKAIEQRYQQKNWLKENAGLIFSFMIFFIICIMMWLLFDKWMDVSGAVTGAVHAAEQVLESSAEILGHVSNIEQGGTGIVPAG